MAWLHNGEVAWEIPRPHIDVMFEWKAYLPPEGWKVETRIPFPRYKIGVCGEIRNSRKGGKT